MTFPPVRVLGSAARVLESQETGRTYQINVGLPLGYDRAPDEAWPFDATPERWPVIYVLDGNWYFGLVTDTIRRMAWCGGTTDAIVVGIGYPEPDDPIDAFRVTFTRRNHDLTPVPDLAIDQQMEARHGLPCPSGDAPNFHRFIQHELIPLIEREYRVDPARRSLMGHSYGGLFTTYSLFTAPTLFQTYIIGSPSLGYGERFAFQYEASYAQAHPELPATVYWSVGADEEDLHYRTLSTTLQFAAIVENRRYAGLTFKKHIFMEQDHCAVAGPGFQWGLKQALKR